MCRSNRAGASVSTRTLNTLIDYIETALDGNYVAAGAVVALVLFLVAEFK